MTGERVKPQHKTSSFRGHFLGLILALSPFVFALTFTSFGSSAQAGGTYTVQAPCRMEESKNACTASFLGCNDPEYRNTIINDLHDRFAELKKTEVETFSEATYGAKKNPKFIRSCDVTQGVAASKDWKKIPPAKNAADCEKQNPGYQYSFNPSSLKFEATYEFGNDTPGKGRGEHTEALYGDLKHAAQECNTQSVITEVLTKHSLEVHEACTPLAQDITQLTKDFEDGAKAHLKSINKSVNNFCEQDFQAEQKHVSMMDACKDDEKIVAGGKNARPDIVRNRQGSCLLAATYYSLFSAFRRLMACEAFERANEQHMGFVNSDYFGKAFYDGVSNSSTGDKIRAAANQAKKLAMAIPPNITGAIAVMQGAAATLTKEHVQRNIETTQKLAKELYGDPGKCGGVPASASSTKIAKLHHQGSISVGNRGPAETDPGTVPVDPGPIPPAGSDGTDTTLPGSGTAFQQGANTSSTSSSNSSFESAWKSFVKIISGT